MNSRVQGTILSAMMAATVWVAASILSYTAIMALEAAGGGISFRVISLNTPRVPSDAVINPARLYPVTHFTVLDPEVTLRPMASKNSTDMT